MTILEQGAELRYTAPTDVGGELDRGDMLRDGDLAFEELDDALNGVYTLEVDDEGHVRAYLGIEEMYAPGAVRQTSLSEQASNWEQVRVFVKHETEQPIGAFKLRGGFAAGWLALQRDPSIRHLVAKSAGNHGQGVAHFARWYNAQPKIDADGSMSTKTEEDMLHVAIFCSESASEVKVTGMEDLGATVYREGHHTLEDAGRSAANFVKSINRKPVSGRAHTIEPYADNDVMAGQSTALLETVLQLQSQGIDLRQQPLIYNVAWGGGGLACGSAVLMERLVNLGVLHPDSHIVAAQMDLCDSTIRAFEAIDSGLITSLDQLNDLYTDEDGVDHFDPSADGTAVRSPVSSNLFLAYFLRAKGRLTFARVTKAEVGRSMQRAAWQGHTLEPAGALADAARCRLTSDAALYLMTNPEQEFIQVVVESGQNVTDETKDDFSAVITEDHPLGGMVLQVAKGAVLR